MAVIVSATVTQPAPVTPFHIMLTVLFTDEPEIVPLFTLQLYVCPATRAVLYATVLPKHGPIAPETTGAGKGLTVIVPVALTAPHPPVIGML